MRNSMEQLRKYLGRLASVKQIGAFTHLPVISPNAEPILAIIIGPPTHI